MYHTRSSLKFSGIIWPLNPNEIKSWNKKEKKRKNNQWNFACKWECLPPIHNSHCTCGYFKGRFEFLFKLKREFEVCYHENTQKNHAWRSSSYHETNKDGNAWSYLYSTLSGVPVVAQQKQIRLGTMRLQVQSLASPNGLRIWHCRELWCRSKMRLGSGVAVAVA